MKKVLLLLLLTLSFTEVYSQFILRKKITEPIPADSTDLAYYSKKKFWGAAGQVLGLNLGLWAFDKYALNAHYANIGMNTIEQNFKRGFVWDNDQMETNMFMHPYHGSLYYNSARSHGYNYWESTAFALGGSFIWEVFLENEYPSINDLISTPIGGAAIGEVLYSLSDLVLDDRKRGSSRFTSELAGFAISPMRGLTRIINGDAWKVRSTSGRQFGTPNLSLDISMGVRLLEVKGPIFDKGAGFAISPSLQYGERFDYENSKPFDYFYARAHMAIQKSQPVLGQANIVGRLWGNELINDKKDFLGFGIYQHFDYYDSDTLSSRSNKVPYKFGTPASFGIGLMHKNNRLSDWAFDSFIHLNAVLLGASLTDYYAVDNRNYNLGSGFSIKTGVNLSYKEKLGAALSWDSYSLFTWKGYDRGIDLSQGGKVIDAQGDKSEATFNAVNLKVSAQLYGQWYLTSFLSWFRRSTHYAYIDYSTVYSFSEEARLMLTYKF